MVLFDFELHFVETCNIRGSCSIDGHLEQVIAQHAQRLPDIDPEASRLQKQSTTPPDVSMIGNKRAKGELGKAGTGHAVSAAFL